MLEGLFGSRRAEQVLIFLAVNQEGYAQAIAGRFHAPLSNVQKQLHRLERGGVLVSRTRGRTRLFTFNPRFPFRRDLQALLLRSLEYLPPSERELYQPTRRRPRATGKAAPRGTPSPAARGGSR